MIQAVDVETRAGYRIWLKYSDGASGEVDLSPFAGRGAFAAWNDRAFFESVTITGGRVMGKPIQDLMPGVRRTGPGRIAPLE